MDQERNTPDSGPSPGWIKTHPRLAGAAVLGLLALIAAVIVIAALSTHSKPSPVTGPLVEFERAVSAVLSEQQNLKTSIRDAKRSANPEIGVRENGSLALPRVRLPQSLDAYDLKRDGRLTAADLSEHLQRLSESDQFKGSPITMAAYLSHGGFADVFRAVDADSDGVLTQRDVERLVRLEYQELSEMLPRLSEPKAQTSRSQNLSRNPSQNLSLSRKTKTPTDHPWRPYRLAASSGAAIR